MHCSQRASPAVLVPRLDLRVAQVQFRGELHTVLDAEVFLSLEALLQRVQLVVGERRPRLARLLGLATGSSTAASAMML